MKRTGPESHQPQSFPPAEMDGDPGEAWALGMSSRPL